MSDEEGYTPLSGADEVPCQTAKDFGMKQESRRRERLRSYAYLLLASLCYTISFHYFVAPSNFAPGGVGGIVALVKFMLRISPDATPGGIDFSPLLIIAVNLVLILCTVKQLSKTFLVRTLSVSVCMTAILFVLDNYIDPGYVFSIAGTPTVDDLATRIIAAIFGGVCCGFALQLALKANASTGGTDIVAAAIQKRNPHKSTAALIFAVNSVVVLVSAVLYKENLMPVFLAFLYMFVTTKTCDAMMLGMKSALKFEVVTDHGEEISKDVIKELGHGATVTPAEGMFERRKRSLLICVIQPRQVSRFKDILQRYPGSFAYIGTVNEIIGKFNHQK